MDRFGHTRAEAVHERGAVHGVPPHVAQRGRWLIQLLLAARDLQDIGAFAQILRWSNLPGRYGIHVDGKWCITYRWTSDFGAVEIKLERR